MDVPLLDKVPGYNIYIGGFISLRRPDALANCKITHILSVLDWRFAKDSPLIRGYQHLHIPVNDVGDENLIEWFPKSNAFIEQGLGCWQDEPQNPGANQSQVQDIDGRSGVLVHCAMGKSRSATIIIAYLLWKSHREIQSLSTSTTSPSAPTTPASSAPNRARDIPLPVPSPSSDPPLTPETALSLLRQARPFAEPNDGFMTQLHLYHSMGCPDSIDSQPKYQRWLYRKAVQESLDVHQAPELEYIRFEDEHEADEDNGVGAGMREINVKCRKCRRLLAKPSFLVEHDPPPVKGGGKAGVGECAHLFLHPLGWMRGSLGDGQLDGRLSCPNERCGANVGKFAWQGMRCSCGGWVTPGFALARGKVDELAVLTKEGKGEIGGAAGLRMPPNMRKDGGHL